MYDRAYYTSVITNAYRAAIDEYLCNETDDYKLSDWIRQEVCKVSYREYCTGFYYTSPLDDAQIFYDGGYKREWNVAAEVTGYENGTVYGFQRNRFFENDELEVMPKG